MSFFKQSGKALFLIGRAEIEHKNSIRLRKEIGGTFMQKNADEPWRHMCIGFVGKKRIMFKEAALLLEKLRQTSGETALTH